MYRMHYLYYINGRLASNEDLGALFAFECRYGVKAMVETSYPRLNVKVTKYTTTW